MSGPKRNEDKLNTIGVVVVGICGAVLVYVTIVALQAFYAGDTSEVQTMADYGGQDKHAREARVAQLGNLNAPTKANPGGGAHQTYSVPLAISMKHVAEALKADPKSAGHLVPGIGPSNKPSTKALFGRAPALGAPTPATPPPTGDTPSPTDSAPLTPTNGQGPGGGPPPGQPAETKSTEPKPATTGPAPVPAPAPTKPATPAPAKPAAPEPKPAAKPAPAAPKAGTR
jgi:hypothetical protein